MSGVQMELVTKIMIQDTTSLKSELVLTLKLQLELLNADQVIGFLYIIKHNYPEIIDKSVILELTQVLINHQLTSF
jgi:hypothetical protein